MVCAKKERIVRGAFVVEMYPNKKWKNNQQ